MIAEGRVFPDRVEYNCLPWEYAAGTPSILGAIVSAQALRIVLDLALAPKSLAYFGTGKPIDRSPVESPWIASRLESPADRRGARRARRHPGDHDLRTPRCVAPHLAGRLQPRRP